MFEVAYDKSLSIELLQKEIVTALNPIRDGIRQKDPVGHVLQDWIPQTSGEIRENFDAFGYDEIGNFFRPHITLTRFKQRNFQVANSLLPPLNVFNGVFTTLGLFEMGQNGTCIRKIEQWELN
jgi:2'-5' RNA ligase